MAETYLNLMNSAAAVSAQVYDQIDRSMTQRLNVEAQAGKFEVDAMAKAAQFAESQRMNDEQIINMRANNYMQAQRLEVDKMLLPIKLETENLRLESQRLALQRQKETEGKAHFNSLTSIYDDQIGYALLQTESPEMAQEYLGYKAQVSDYVAKGGKFDSSTFEKSLASIRSKYQNVQPTSLSQVEYNPQTSYLLGQVSPKLQSEYDKRHPLVSGSRNSVANNFYNADDKGLNSIMASGVLDKLYDKDKGEIGQLWIGRQAVQGNYSKIEMWNKDLDRARNSKSQAMGNNASEDALAEYDKNIALYTQQIREAMDQNAKIFRDTSMGKYGIQTDVVPPVSNKPGKGSQKPFEDDASVGSVKRAEYPNTEPIKQAIHQGTQEVWKAVAQPGKTYYETELRNIDMGYWQQANTGEIPTLEARSYIKEKAEEGIKDMIPKGKSVNVVATKEKINNLLEILKDDIDIPVSSTFANSINKGGDVVTGSEYLAPKGDGSAPSTTETLTFGSKKNKGMFSRGAIRTADDLFAIVNRAPSGAARENALLEVYGSLLAAAQSSAVITKAK